MTRTSRPEQEPPRIDLSGLEGARAWFGATSLAEQIAGVLRTQIAEGFFQPGGRLPEKALCERLGVARNTLREAFRLLTHERLLVHELNSGVYVRKPTPADVTDIYRVRRLLECSVVRSITRPPVDLSALQQAVKAGRAAVRKRDWRELGTANIRYHEGIAALAGSPRIDETMRRLLAELRLVFAVIGDVREFFEPYLPRNVEILKALEAGDGARAERLLSDYLDEAEAQIVAAYTERLEGAS